MLRLGAPPRRGRNLELLTDHGPEFTSGVLRELLARLDLTHCRTPRRSPESNGAVEAFFGSLKRDSVAHHELPTATHAAVLRARLAERTTTPSPRTVRSPAETYARFLQTQPTPPKITH